MENNLHRIEKDLRSIAKRYKSVKYSIGLAILFLMLGVSAFSEEVNTKAQVAQIATREELKTSVGDVQTKLNVLRNENKKEIENSKLELIQLMEQGDQVVKSPWASWQFGVNYFHEKQNGEYKGRGDKPKKYVYNAEYQRGDWKTINASDGEDAQRPQGPPLLVGKPGGIGSSSSLTGQTVTKNTETYSSVNGKNTYGLVDLRYVKEKPTDVEIFAKVNPKKVEKSPVDLPINIPAPPPMQLLDIKPKVNVPEGAPKITPPEIGKIVIEALNINAPTAPTAPTINVNVTKPVAPTAPTINVEVAAPEVTAMSITPPGAVNVVPPNVVPPIPVAFSVAPTIDSSNRKIETSNQTGIDGKFTVGQTYNVDTVTDTTRNFFTLNAITGNVTLPNSTINVKIADARAMVIDEPKNGSNFKMAGTINLYKSKNMGIDLQGSANTQNILAKITNTGSIVGHAKDETGAKNEKQIAFGFSNVDSSYDDTMTHIINKGIISLNAPQSAGMQLKPEDPHNWQPDWHNLEKENNKYYVQINTGTIPSGNTGKGRVLMKADNQKDINIASTGSFGIITVFNPGISALDTVKMSGLSDKQRVEANLRGQRNLAGTTILPGGEIGRSSAGDQWTSGVYNSGNINIDGTSSVGVGILQEIQEVKVGGKINIGTATAAIGSGSRALVENAVGIYAAVPTRPLLKGETGSHGGTATKDIGTKTVEFGPFGHTGDTTKITPGSGTITIGENATKSIGLLVSDSEEELNPGADGKARTLKRSGSITANTGANIIVNGDSNYGFVIKSESYKSEFKTFDVLTVTKGDTENFGRGINKGTIAVNGTNSIAFALLKGGDSSNEGGNLIVNPLTTAGAQGSTAFYGEQGKFTNSGDIKVNTPNNTGNRAVLLKGVNSDSTKPIEFTNTASISVQGKGNIGVYAEGNAKFNHNENGTPATNKISVGDGSIGVYVKKSLEGAPKLNIAAPVELAATTGDRTTIGFYSDGEAEIKFKDGFKLEVGNNSIGLFSQDTSKFASTFDVSGLTTTTEVKLGQKSALSYFNDGKTGNVGSVLTKDKFKIKMDDKSTLAYAENGSKVTLDQGTIDTTDATRFSSVSSTGTSLLLATGEGSKVAIGTGVNVTTTTQIGLIATAKAIAENLGTYTQKLDGSVGIYANESTASNSGTMTMENKASAAIFGENNSGLTNTKNITIKAEKSAGILANDSNATNSGTTSKIVVKGTESAGISIQTTLDKTVTPNKAVANGEKVAKNEGTITLESTANKSAAMLGKRAAGTPKVTLSNDGTINIESKKSVGINADNTVGDKEKLVVNNNEIINVKAEESAGINAIKATVTNTAANGLISLTAKKTAGIIAKAGSSVINNAKISTSGVTVAAPTATSSEGLVGISADASTVTNGSTGKIELDTAYSTAIYGTNVSTIGNEGTIQANKDGSVGIYVEGNSPATNSGTITMKGESSAGIYGDESKIVNETVNGKITIEEKASAGMYAKNAVAENNEDATITVKKESSAGMYLDVDKANITANGTNKGTITLDTGATKSAGILAKLTAPADKVLTVTNEGDINVNGGTATNPSVAISAVNSTSTVGNLLVENKKNINLASEKSIGIFLDKSKSINESTGNINVKGKESTGVFAKNTADFENKGTITVEAPTNEKAVGIFATGTGTKVVNSKDIKVLSGNSVGIFGEKSATVQNAGNIELGTIGSTLKGLIGMFGQSKATAEAVKIENLGGTINVNTESSAGMYANNTSGNIANVTLENTGTINVNGKKSAGIYAPKSTVSKVGEINLIKDADGASAVYIEDGGKVTAAETAVINLGTANQNRVAYYVKNASSNVEGTNIGKIMGYGVGLYLQGAATSKAALNANTATLDYTANGATGDGIIGLYLAGDTDISTYNKAIKVGDTNGSNYAIGIYTDAQKDKTSAYNIMQNITAGKAGVGIFADKGSILKYTGTMKVGENGGTDTSSGGVGIYVANQGGAGSNVTLDSAANIELYGKGGVGAIVTDGSTFTANTGSKIELKEGPGVGVYGLKGSIINAQNLVFINNGYQAEKIRTIGGQAHIAADETLASGIVLTHVINGETSLASGKTITASGNNIGLMAEGIKDPAATPAWKNGDYEVLNKGILNFSNAIKSTAIYSVSSRAKNEGSIEVGNESTGIYGEYDKNTPKYDGTTPNKSLIETTATSSITLKGNESTGIYLKNLKGVENKGSITAIAGKTQNIGIYAINDGTANDVTGNQTLNLKNTGAISLGDASVAIYSKGESDTLRNKVENTGDITVGKKLTIGGTAIPSVGIYAENTDVKTNSTITVGENGIGFYGKNSEIEARGTANFSNKGILAYLIDSKFTSYLGNLSGSNNTMLFIKNSQVNLAGNGTPVDVTVDDDQTGMYIEGTSSTLTGVRNINLGKNSTGMYLKDTNFTSTADEITSTSQKAKGIIAVNSMLTNNSKISLSGDNSVGIYSEANNTKTVTNNGKLNIAGKQTLGVFLKGSQTFVNTADIDVADTTSSVNTEKTIGIYTKEGTSTIKHNSGTINVGKRSIGIFSSINSAIELANPAKINVKDEGIGIYKENGTVSLAGTLTVDPHTATTPNSEPVGLYARNGVTITDNLTSTTIGEKSYGIILNSNSTSNVYTNTSTGNVELGNDSVYLYSEGNANITNNRTVAPTANANRSIAFYVKGNGIGSTKFVNNGNIDLSVGKGTIGVYAPNAEAINKANITVGRTDDIDPTTGQVYTDRNKITYAIGMATADRGKIYNEGNIILTGNKSLGMYGDGEGTAVENSVGGKIILKPGATATATDKITNMTGVLVNNGATFINKGDITTDINYSYNPNVSGLIGVAVLNGSKLENHGNITIDADNSYGIVIRGEKNADGSVKKYAEIKNYGNITVRGTGTMGISWKDVKPEQIAALKAQIGAALKADPGQNAIYDAGDTNKGLEGVDIKIVNGQPIVTRNGVVVPSEIVNQILVANNVGMSDIGFYIDTLGATKPIDINMNGGTLPPINSQLIVGTEYSKKTNSKQWYVTDGVIQPFLNMIAGQNFKLASIAGSLTWMATPVLDSSQNIVGISMAKIPYTAFVEKTDNAYNFTDGLEQRYDMNALDSREKEIFNKLNGIGKNEGTLLSQAYDEMMGHQYANTQQRIQATGKILDKEFSYLRNSWSNPSKDSNKVKTFGMSGEYKTDTAGIIDYKNNAYGVAYVHEDETVRLGESTGWYAGIVHNTFKFKDIGNSKEEQLQAKVGAFKSIPFDYNNSLNWTISGDIFVGYNKMHRKFLVVDEVFNAKSKYNTYGIGIKNEIGKEFRLSEGLSVRPYGAVKVEYGRVSKIKEKSGEMKLEVKSNDYLSIKPEIGTELAYKLHLGNKTLRAALAVAYENELGRVANGKNKARVAGTSADWFNIRGEKEDRRGNVKTDLNVGVDNQRIGVTGNIGYDTKGRNVRGGLGLRVIF
ncbi:autotransporter-associated N-terminal domain-containing protein [Fusobacterium pseudoperiodonticum]|uniref:autotransporter-associated N-terminal domain-containing protein n=1 Tax=Fusobacterium pseudoperiodonticum TaxID=2663009 RepID=UPI000C1C235A|nr:autotransporter-associated N-terminal domain-containing protein [Fusobacterium pseudoperiodonticum]ATV64939.1 autotransporter domain-containing protein [Fusobacterium pseudoperiodonticum]